MSTDGIQAYPLQWPFQRQRAKRRIKSDFGTPKGGNSKQAHTVGRSVENILNELRLMGARGVVISSNIALRNDGLPRSGQPAPSDPGVAVYFNYDKQPVCLACDQYHKVEDNLWSVYLTLAAMRGIDRWGAAKLAATFTGYAALPPPATEKPWWEVLGVSRNATADQIRIAYRMQAKQHHPDAGGNHEKFLTVQAAFEQAQQAGLVA